MSFSQKLKAKVEERQMTGARLADVSGISRATITHLMRGRNHPSWDSVQRICKALDCKFEELTDDNVVLSNAPERPRRGRPRKQKAAILHNAVSEAFKEAANVPEF